MDGPRHIWWNFVSSRKERIEQAKAEWTGRPFRQGAGRRDRVHSAAGEIAGRWGLTHSISPGRTVFIAGGTSGINLGIAEAFAAAGAKVAVIGRSQERLDRALQHLRALAPDATGFSADVRDAQAVAAALKSTHDAFGAIDVLVSGAAGNFPSTALGMSPNGFKAVVDIDLLGTFNVLRMAHEFLRKPGASIVNISAPQAIIPMAMQAHVCAAKAGVDMLTRVLALEWGGDGIRVNSVIPGPIEGTEGMARLGADARGCAEGHCAAFRSAAWAPGRTSPIW